jgi:LAO/AO transport system kinase
MNKLLSSQRHSFVIGITGAPGAGKSTLVGALIRSIRESGERVAVIAVDPSSPFSQGALLGDRVRMTSGDRDHGVFIRSMASRGEQGGVAAATYNAALTLEACDWPIVIIETVGAGQVEVNIAAMADATVVVVNPGWGDEIQAHKAGLMEVGDVFAINKADRDGTADTRRDLETLLAQRPSTATATAIVETIATDDRGVGELFDKIFEHRQEYDDDRLEQRRIRQTKQILQLAIEQEFRHRAEKLLASRSFNEAITKVVDNEQSITAVVDDLLNDRMRNA